VNANNLFTWNVQADTSLDRLLKSLDLEKYSMNFQAEEACFIYVVFSNHGCATNTFCCIFTFQVDMKALVHMNEEDMKSLGIPMVLQELKFINCLSYNLEACSLFPQNVFKECC
jgi:hypothetical protein